MSGFWAGFAQGYSDEKDRIEQRKQYQDALEAKKKEMLLAIGIKRAELGMDSKNGNGGSAHAAALARMGANPDTIAQLAKVGGPQALKGAYDQLIKANKDNTNIMTQEGVNQFLNGLVVDVQGGNSADISGLANDMGVSLTPTEQEYFNLQTTTPQTVTVLPPLPTPARATVEQEKAAIGMANDRLTSMIDDQIAATNKAIAAGEAGAVERGQALKTAKADLANGSTAAAKALVGTAVVQDIADRHPELADALTGWAGTTQAAQPAAPITRTDSGLIFNTDAEAQAAIDSGKIAPGATFRVGDKIYTNE